MVEESLRAIAEAWPELLAAAAGLAVLVGAGQAARRMGVPAAITRSGVHVGTGAFVVALPSFFAHPAPVTALAACFVLLNGVARGTGRLGALHAARPESFGTVTFPLALAVTAPFFWSPERQGLLQTAFLVLAVADPLGSAVGRRAPGRRRLAPASGSAKSWDGLAAVAVGAGVAGAVGAYFFIGPFGGSSGLGPIRTSWTAGLSLALLVPAVELLGARGWDNLFVVVAAATALLLLGPAGGSASSVFLAGAVAAGFGLGAHRAGWLDTYGAVAGALFAASLLAIGGASWTVPALVFFVGSSLLSRGASSRRTAAQVYANGGWAWALLVGHLWMPHPAWLAGFLGALAAATADTWSAEIGPRLQDRPVHVWTGRRVPKGTSGAVSWAGTGAGLVGALAVGLGYLGTTPPGDPFGSPWVALGLCGLAGLLGSAVDTVLGASVQALYRHRIGDVAVEERPRPPVGTSPPGRRSEPRRGRVNESGGHRGGAHWDDAHPEEGGAPLGATPDPWQLVRGHPRVENDRVNAAATAVGALVAATWFLVA